MANGFMWKGKSLESMTKTELEKAKAHVEKSLSRTEETQIKIDALGRVRTTQGPAQLYDLALVHLSAELEKRNA